VQRQTCLAGAPDADQRDDAVLADQFGDLGDVGLAPDEGVELGWKVSEDVSMHPELGECVATDLVDPLVLVETLE